MSEEYIEDIKSLIKNQYKQVEYINSGADGTVFKATKYDNTVVAIKVGHDLDDEIVKLEILKNGCEVNLVSCYYGSYKLDNMNVIEMEYIDGWNVEEFIKIKSKTIEQVYYYLLLITMDVMRALKYIHSKNIIHNDLWYGNIIINKKTNVPKVIDFGGSVFVGQTLAPWLDLGLDPNSKKDDYYVPTPVDDLTTYKNSLDDLLYEWHRKHGNNPDTLNYVLFNGLLENMETLTPDKIITLIENNIVRPSF